MQIKKNIKLEKVTKTANLFIRKHVSNQSFVSAEISTVGGDVLWTREPLTQISNGYILLMQKYFTSTQNYYRCLKEQYFKSWTTIYLVRTRTDL